MYPHQSFDAKQSSSMSNNGGKGTGTGSFRPPMGMGANMMHGQQGMMPQKGGPPMMGGPARMPGPAHSAPGMGIRPGMQGGMNRPGMVGMGQQPLSGGITRHPINQPGMPQQPEPNSFQVGASMPSMMPVQGMNPMLPRMSGGMMGMQGSMPMMPMPQQPQAPPVPEVPKPTIAPPCHLHRKHKDKCKFCEKHKESKQAAASSTSAGSSANSNANAFPASDPILKFTNDSTFNVNALLRDQILKSGFFKSLLDENHQTAESVIEEVYARVDNVEPYVLHSSTEPSTFFCCLYRLFTMRLTSEQLRTILNMENCPYIRVIGFLYMRYVLHCDLLWEWAEEYLFDTETFKPSPKSEPIEMGLFVEKLISEDKYYDTMLPRLPQAAFRQKKANFLAQLSQYRARHRANARIIEEYSVGRKIEACSKGDWLDGEVIEVVDYGTRIVVKCQLEDGADEAIPLGMIILPEDEAVGYGYDDEDSYDADDWREDEKEKDREDRDDRRDRDRDRDRGDRDRRGGRDRDRGDRDKDRDRRNRSRDRPEKDAERIERRKRKTVDEGRIDLTRSRGDNITAEMMEEYINKTRGSALATGKDYAAKPQGYKAMLAMSRTNYGSEERRMTEEETFIRQERRKRRGDEEGKGGSGAPQMKMPKVSDEQQAQKQKIMERYSSSGPPVGGSSRRPGKGTDGPDVFRFG